MVRRRAVFGGLAFVVALAASLTIYGVGKDEEIYPRQYEGGSSDVSLETAFMDHQLEVPGVSDGIRYSASKNLHGYPMFSDFSMSWEEARGYFEGNGLQEHDDFLVHVLRRAQRIGWNRDDGGTYFLRESIGLIYQVEALLVETTDGGETCHVYLESAG
jgi:hypothetical protein